MSRLVLSCEHASNAVPPGVALGVEEGALDSHVAWDPGAREVALALAAGAAAPVFLGQWTRLFVDLNRHLDPAAVVPVEAFGVAVPGNRALGEEERARRVARWHRPHRDAVEAAVAAAAGPALHLSVHSFTAALDPVGRAFDVGLLFDPARAAERAWAARLGAALRAADLDCRENQPYLGTSDGLTTWLRGRFPPARYAGIELELCVERAVGARVVQALGDLLGAAARGAGSAEGATRRALSTPRPGDPAPARRGRR